MIHKDRKMGSPTIRVTFELPPDLRKKQCSLVGDFNKWDSKVDIFSPKNNFCIQKEFEGDSEHQFLYYDIDTQKYFHDPQSDGACPGKDGLYNSLIVSKISDTPPMRIFGLNLSFIQEQLFGIFLLLGGFVVTLYIFGIYLAFHGANFVSLIQLPFDSNCADKALKIIQGVGNFDFVSFQADPEDPTLFALFLEIYTWCALGVLANQAYEIYQKIIAPGPVLALLHVASWLRAIIARPPIAAIIILLLEALDIRIGSHQLSSIEVVLSLAFLAGFSGSLSDELILNLISHIQQVVRRSTHMKEAESEK